MLKALIGRKLNMSTVYDSHGRVTPVTKISFEPNIVLAVRDKEKDGYRAAQVGVGQKRRSTKPMIGHVKGAKLEAVPRIIREVDYEGKVKPGDKFTVDEIFRKGSLVDIVGTSKGKGFAGVVKRHGFAGGPKTHGQSDRHRAPGSIGSGTTPGRVQKGMKMAGHLGNERVSIFGLEIMEINKDEGTMLVKGSVPGFVGNDLIIKKSKRKKEAYHEPEIPTIPNLGGADEGVPSEELSSGEEKQSASQPEKQTAPEPANPENNG